MYDGNYPWELQFKTTALQTALAYAAVMGISLRIATGHPGAEDVLEIRHKTRSGAAAPDFTIYRPVDINKFALVDNEACEMEWFDDLMAGLRSCRRQLAAAPSFAAAEL